MWGASGKNAPFNILEGFWDQKRAKPAVLKLLQNGHNLVKVHEILFWKTFKILKKTFFIVEKSHFENEGSSKTHSFIVWDSVRLRPAPIFEVRFLSDEKRFFKNLKSFP